MSNQNAQANPFHWLGLLRWSLSQQSQDYDSEASKMSEEDKKWLAECMETMVRDDSKYMTDIMKKLGDLFINTSPDSNPEYDESIDEEGEALLEELQDVVCQIDMAINFLKMKGLDCLTEILQNRSVPTRTRAAAAGTMATLAQNNLPVQEAMLKAGYLVLFSNILQESEADSLKVKCLGALSSLIRSHPEAEDTFCNTGGPKLLRILLTDSSLRMKRKVVFLIQALIGFQSADVIQQRATQMWSVIEFLVHFLEFEEDLEIRENSLQILTNICEQGLSQQLGATSGEQLQRAYTAVQERAVAEGGDAEAAKNEINMWQDLNLKLKVEGSNSEEVSNTQNDNTEGPAILLIEPYKDIAASPPP